jgi:hypothetical protein
MEAGNSHRDLFRLSLRRLVTKYYRVRKSWAEKSSQIGAFTVFQNAKNCVDANPGYAAFDDNGNQVYPAVQIRPLHLTWFVLGGMRWRKCPTTSRICEGRK